MNFCAEAHPHRRYDPLGDEWILVSPHRTDRPWQGDESAREPAAGPAHDASCYLCPGNRRATGAHNPDYVGPYVFDNDYPALRPDVPGLGEDAAGLLRSRPVRGEARVICFSPHHSRTLAQLDEAEIAAVVACWRAEAADLGARYAWVQAFENKGVMMGCSNPHPHGQIWATDSLPHMAATECRTQAAWLATHGSSMLADLVAAESGGPRAIIETAEWLVLVPYWAKWPFETLLVPRFAVMRFTDLDASRDSGLAHVLSRLARTYDALFGVSFPYSMGWHGAPFDANEHPEWRLHAHFYPPLLRSASVRKFMVGYEMLAEAQRDLTPEAAADRLRAAVP
jgi:UDPglucose--hexose-1-phosphate uridylyltransferase